MFGKNFDVRTRDLVLLRFPSGEKGYEVWLDLGYSARPNDIVPHEGGKYAQAGQVIIASIMGGH